MAQQPVVGQGLLIVETSRSHRVRQQSRWLLWTSDQPEAGTRTWQDTTLTADWLLCRRWEPNWQSQQARAADPHFRPRGHWDRQFSRLIIYYYYYYYYYWRICVFHPLQILWTLLVSEFPLENLIFLCPFFKISPSTRCATASDSVCSDLNVFSSQITTLVSDDTFNFRSQGYLMDY